MVISPLLQVEVYNKRGDLVSFSAAMIDRELQLDPLIDTCGGASEECERACDEKHPMNSR